MFSCSIRFDISLLHSRCGQPSRERKSKNYSADWYFERIRYLGYVFEYEIEMYDEYIKFQDVLDVVDQSNISMYDTQDKFEFKVNRQTLLNL